MVTRPAPSRSPPTADRWLRLEAHLKIPGRAWLDFEVLPRDGGSSVRLSAIFEPRGLTGILYWYALLPLHHLLFGGMLRAIVHAGGDQAERLRARQASSQGQRRDQARSTNG